MKAYQAKEPTPDVFYRTLTDYLVPLIYGTTVEGPYKSREKARELVYFETGHKLHVNADLNDETYHVTLKRAVPFSNEEKAFITAIAESMDAAKKSFGASFHYVLCESIERTIAASVDATCAEAVYETIQIYTQWASEVYEGERIAHTVGIHSFSNSKSSGAILGDLRNAGAVKLLGATPDTLLVTDAHGMILGLENISMKLAGYRSNRDALAPIHLNDTAMWTNSQRKVAVHLTTNGEILIFRKKVLKFAKRRGVWHAFPHKAVLDGLLSGDGEEQEAKVKKSVYLTVLDMAFSGHGACIGVLPPLPGKEPGALPVSPESLLQTETPSPIIGLFKELVDGRKFHELPRKIRVSLCRVDGALLLDSMGNIQAVGAIVKTKGAATGGGRTAAAQALGENGIGIKVSQDGCVEMYANGRSFSPFA